MKTTMKLFAAIVLMLGFATSTIGQSTNTTGNIASNAYVLSALAVSSQASLEFGNLLNSGFKKIALDGTPTGSVIGGLQRTGVFKVSKGANTTVSLSFTVLPTVLDITPPATATLPIDSYEANWNASSSSGASGTPVPVDGTALPGCGALADADFYVHIGATVTPTTAGGTAATVVGAYTGTITLKAEYN